jgi:dienelactone hydrolase
VQTLVWYPAQAGGQALRFRDYMATSTAPDNFQRSADEIESAVTALSKGMARGARADAVRQEIARAVAAHKDAPEQRGKFPVVIYAPSFSAPAVENTDLCEYLASQGYIVLASPSIGARGRFMTSDLQGLEAQAGDIAFLMAYARTLPQADAEQVAVLGFSWGGLANVMAAAKDDRIKAIISLDGSVRGFPEYVNGGKDSARYVTPARLAMPMMYIGRRPSTLEEINQREIDTSFSLMNRMKHSDVYIVTMQPMQHADFSSWAQRFASDTNFTEYSREEVALAYSWSARYVHRFLDAYLKRDAASRTFLDNTPLANQAPRHMITMDARHGDGTPATMEAFVQQLYKRGFSHAIEIYQELKAKDANFTLGDANFYNSFGYQYLRGGKPQEGAEIFRLGTHLYPNDGNLFDSLAEACEKTGDKAAAIQHYKRALQLDPKNANATQRLQALAEGTPKS